jgi:hypothetical protein
MFGGQSRFTLDIIFDNWPEEVTWELRSIDRSYAVVLTRESSLKAGTFEYSPDFELNKLPVDHCIPAGNYEFTIFDSYKDGLAFALAYYEIASNGRVIWRESKYDDSKATSFSSEDGSTLTPIPTTTPSAGPSFTPQCESNEGMFEMEVFHDGDPADFNIATTALESNADAPEVYHFYLGNDDIGKMVRRQGCFKSNTLNRFVVYNNETAHSLQPRLNYSLYVNQRLIASGSNVDDTFESYYFVGDTEVCAEGESRFTLDILFDFWPEEVTWVLMNIDRGYAVVLTHEWSLKAGTFEYSPDFSGTSFPWTNVFGGEL